MSFEEFRGIFRPQIITLRQKFVMATSAGNTSFALVQHHELMAIVENLKLRKSGLSIILSMSAIMTASKSETTLSTNV